MSQSVLGEHFEAVFQSLREGDVYASLTQLGHIDGARSRQTAPPIKHADDGFMSLHEWGRLSSILSWQAFHHDTGLSVAAGSLRRACAWNSRVHSDVPQAATKRGGGGPIRYSMRLRSRRNATAVMSAASTPLSSNLRPRVGNSSCAMPSEAGSATYGLKVRMDVYLYRPIVCVCVCVCACVCVFLCVCACACVYMCR